ncbi:hypothetical protein [uncultured Jatrophihabitans sp.]|uniref:hypothetical protein n=1 Tax=uncultured Jatrophihabitans sp. TaxID=1610747 RepID=UPI0035C97C4F
MSSLTAVPAAKRRQLAATLGLFSVLFVAIGAVAATGLSSGLVLSFVVIAFVLALVLALMSWGVAISIKDEIAERRLDDALEAALAAHGAAGGGGGGRVCGCGHEHDPDELHIVDQDDAADAGPAAGAVAADVCAHDGAGADCAHSCDTCVLAGARADDLAQDRPRPAPARRPSPTR